MDNMEERQVEYWNRYGKYGKKVSRIVKWCGKYGGKVSLIVKRQQKYGRKVGKSEMIWKIWTKRRY
jgi:hypothetical protein